MIIKHISTELVDYRLNESIVVSPETKFDWMIGNTPKVSNGNKLPYCFILDWNIIHRNKNTHDSIIECNVRCLMEFDVETEGKDRKDLA
ncbi:hypothetical protein Mucpa_2479 [Mucilaginibacter paludis DSM 18603]|uniref:Uncharacterized protein n=1 Tax=Mucilaginibacter paludis DSM 18603 TaxID=714943 RepID=H1YIN2_9SPHI|nr:hypothetical protein Mucpa_2479 [Mucilaginibacter paludis DSM 18603]